MIVWLLDLIEWAKRPRAKAEAEPENEWVNVAPDGRGGGVWINPWVMQNMNIQPTRLSGGVPPPPPRPDAANSARPPHFVPDEHGAAGGWWCIQGPDGQWRPMPPGPRR